MTLSTYDKALNLGGIPVFGTAISSAASPFFIMNTDGETVTGTPHDPWAVIAEDASATGHANVRPIAVPTAYSFLEVYLIHDSLSEWSGTCDVRIFGRVHRQSVSHGRQWPFDDDAVNFNDVSDIWVPLIDVDSASQNIALDAFLVGAEHTVGADVWKISPPRIVTLAGVEEIVCLVNASLPAGGGHTVSMIGGRFTT